MWLSFMERETFISLVAIAALAAPQLAGAEEADSLLSMSLEELMEIEIVTTSKFAQTASEASAFTTVITREDIEQYAYRSLAEALGHAAGFYRNTDLAYEYVGVRGFGTPGDYNSRVLILVDGHRINDPIYDYGAIGEDFPIDIEGIERIEIARGPGSALWGSNALLAVINVVPRKGADIDGVEMAVEFGGNDRFKGHAAAGRRFDNGVEIATHFAGMRSEGRREIYFPEYDDPATNYGIAENADGAHVLRGYFTGSYRGFKVIVTGATSENDDPAAGFQTIFNEPTSIHDQRVHAETSYQRALLPEKNGQLFVRMFHDYSYYQADYLYDYPPVTTNDDMGEAKSWGSELRYSMDVLDRLNVIAGVEYVDNYALRMRSFDEDPHWEYLDVRADYQMISGYAQGDFEVFGPLRLVAGVRADDHSKLSQTQWSPRAALILTPTQALLADSTFKLMYGQAFRAPNFYERDYGDVGTGIGMVGNPDLDPEEMETYELVWEQKLFDHTRLNVGLFYYEFNDIIQQITNIDGNLQFINGGTVRSKGVELELDTRLPSGILGHLAFSATKAKDADGHLANSPKFLLNASLSVPVLSPRVRLAPQILFVGNRLDIAGDTVDSSVQLNLTLTAKLGNGLVASATAYNLADADVFVPARPEHLQSQIPLEGRSFRFQLKYLYH